MAEYVEITDIKNGVAYKVNPGQVETLRAKVSAGISTTIVDLADGATLETAVALATVQAALEAALPAGGGGGGIAETLLDAKGDLIVASAADTAAKLTVGTDGYVLTADAASPNGVKWEAAPGASGGIAATIFDAKGDIIAASAADTAARLAVGTNGQVLTAASGEATGLQWTTPTAETLPATIFAAKGDILSASANDTPLILSAGTNGHVLTLDSAEATGLKWAASSGGIAATIVDAKGDIIAATAADTVARLAVGTNGQVLTAASGEATGLQWATPTAETLPATIMAAKGDLISATANDTPSILTVGADGQSLVADSTASAGIKWGSPTTLFSCSSTDSLGTKISDSGAVATIARVSTLQGAAAIHGAGYEISTTGGASGKCSMWPLDITFPNKRCVLDFWLGPRNAGGTIYGANFSPWIGIGQDITHMMFLFRDSTTPTTAMLGYRNASTTTSDTASNGTTGVNSDLGQRFQVFLEWVDSVNGVSDPQIILQSSLHNATAAQTQYYSTLTGTGMTPSGWNTALPLKIFIGGAETGAGAGVTYIAINVSKHPQDR